MSDATTERVTMYKVAHMLSAALGKRVHEQQMYQYRAKGYIKVGEDGRVSTEEAEAFVADRVVKAAQRAEKKAQKDTPTAQEAIAAGFVSAGTES